MLLLYHICAKMDTIMCIQWKTNKLGCSYYSSSSLDLFLMDDIKESKDFEYTEMRKKHNVKMTT